MVFLDNEPRMRIGRLLMVCAAIVVLQADLAGPCEAAASAGEEVADSASEASIELREGLAIPAAHDRRSAVSFDPIVAQMLSGTWVMPRAGDSVAVPGSQAKKWEPVKAGPDGSFSGGALRGGYLASSFWAAADSVMILESTGHGLVYAGGEPRGGDPYSNGYVHLPVKVWKGQNALLFQVGRGKLTARLTKPKGPAFLSTADMTLPDLIAGESVQAQGAVIVVNASSEHREDLAISAKVAGGAETRTVVPDLVPLSIRKVAFELGGTGPSTGETTPLELRLERKAKGSGGWETIDSSTVKLQVRQTGQTYSRTFRSSIDGSVQYYAVVPPLPAPDGGAAA